MLYDLHHEVPIAAPARNIYEAIATQEGLRSWLTPNSTAEPRVGTVAQFGFNLGLRALILRVRIDELKPGQRIVWYCLGDDEEWKNTRMIWNLEENDGRTVLHLLHAYWRSPGTAFASANSKWGESVYRLKDYVEGTVPDRSILNRLKLGAAG